MADNLPAVVERTPLYTCARGICWGLFHTFCPMRWHHTELLASLPAPCILLANHQSFIDPMAMAVPIKGYEIRFLGKSELIRSKLMNKVLRALHMIPVARHATDMSAMRACMQALREGHILGIFPEGTRHQPEMMHEVESGAAFIALRAKVPVIPIYIDSRIRPFHKTQVYFGAPMDMDDLYAMGVNTESVQILCERIRTVFYQLRDDAKSGK